MYASTVISHSVNMQLIVRMEKPWHLLARSSERFCVIKKWKVEEYLLLVNLKKDFQLFFNKELVDTIV